MSYRVMINIDPDWPNPGDLVIIGFGKFTGGHIPCYDQAMGGEALFLPSGKHFGLVLPDSSSASRRVPILWKEKTIWTDAKNLKIVEEED